MYPGNQKACQTSLRDVFTLNNSRSLRNRPIVKLENSVDWPKPMKIIGIIEVFILFETYKTVY